MAKEIVFLMNADKKTEYGSALLSLKLIFKWISYVVNKLFLQKVLIFLTLYLVWQFTSLLSPSLKTVGE